MSWDNGTTDNWDSTPAAPAAAADDSWKASSNGKYSGGDARMMENGASGSGGAGGGGGCRNCGQEGHFAKECPEPRKERGACFNCGQEGHSKADCTNPRVFTGTCRVCQKEGHAAAECPDKPADICRNCRKEGHKVAQCKENRVMNLSAIADLKPEIAWEKLRVADEARDLDDFREAFKEYIKAVPETTYDQVERAFRHLGFKTHVIASEKEVTSTFTLMNLQGKLDCKYTVGFFYSDQPQRLALKQGWPSSLEENLERLKDAGIPVERGIPKCSNCDELGHISKSCPEDKMERELVTVKCVNCDELGHRARDCTTARKDKFACRNCGQPGHQSTECTEPRSAANVECKNCNEIGHFAKDCPTKAAQACRNCGQEGHMSKECDQPRNPATTKCRNCEEIGHFSKDCPKPRDYSKVQCQNCKQMGHTKVRCKEPPAAENGFDAAAGGFDSAAGGFDNAGLDNAAPATVAAGTGDDVAW